MRAASRLRFSLIILLLAVSLLGLSSVYPTAQVRAAFPGHNGLLAYTSNASGNYEIYAARLDGAGRINLSNSADNEGDAAWSPDGSKIVFFSDRDGNQQIYTMYADGSNQVNVSNNSHSDTSPAWSPDGKRILFRSSRDGDLEIYVMNADGSNQINLSNNPGNDSTGRWSPDGSKIVFTSDRGGKYQIHLMDPDGSNQQNLSNNGYREGGPMWSLDGTKIFFTSDRTGVTGIYSMDTSGGNVTPIVVGSAINTNPSPTPDGTKIVFTSERDGNQEIYIADIDGSNQKRITNDIHVDQVPSVQPIVNEKPTANKDVLFVESGTATSVDVLQNDTDEEVLDAANLTIHTQPSHGAASIELGKVKYTPNHNYVGADQLTYQICDSFMLDQKCSTAVLSITVKPAAVIARVGDKVIENGVEKIVASSNRPIFSGVATPYSVVKVEIHSDPIILTTTADENGDWSITPEQDLPPGDHTVYISSTLNGVTTELDSFVLAVQQTIPNTGFNSLLTRIGGGLLLIFGLSLVYWQRRRMRELFKHQVPQLFP